MCITPEEIRKIVHQELDNKLVLFMDKVDASINARILHLEPSPKTKEEIAEIRAQLARQSAAWDGIHDLLRDVKEIKDSMKDITQNISATNDWKIAHEVKAETFFVAVTTMREIISRLNWIVISAVILGLLKVVVF